MPQPSTSAKPLKERAKLRNAREVQNEIRKLYRRFSNKAITASELKSRVVTLTALRSGMADDKAEFSGGGTIHYTILPIASGTFLSKEAADELAATGQLPPDAVFELIELAQPHHIQQLDYAPQANNVLTFHNKFDDEEALLAKLETLSDEQLREIAKQVGCDVDND